jgi:hypothetical protein
MVTRIAQTSERRLKRNGERHPRAAAQRIHKAMTHNVFAAPFVTQT